MLLRKFIYLVLACLIYPFQPALADNTPNVLVVTNSKTLPPLSFLNQDGEPRGILIELWREFGKQTGKNIKFQLVDWNMSLELVKTGQADIHAGLFKSKERDAYLDFTDPIRISLATRMFVSQKLKVSSLNELGKIPIGVVKGDFTQTFIRDKYPSIQQRPYINTIELVKAALEGEVLAFASDYPTAMYYLHKMGSPEQFHVADTLYMETLYAAVAEDNGKLLEFVNQGLRKIPDDEFERITQKWIQSEPTIPKWVVPSFFCILGFLLIVFSLLYIFALKRQVSSRTKKLEQALKEVKALSGLLPICSNCKKIRDDTGYWSQVEDYISKHSEAVFSHGVCPDCLRALYPDIADEVLNKVDKIK